MGVSPATPLPLPARCPLDDHGQGAELMIQLDLFPTDRHLRSIDRACKQAPVLRPVGTADAVRRTGARAGMGPDRARRPPAHRPPSVRRPGDRRAARPRLGRRAGEAMRPYVSEQNIILSYGLLISDARLSHAGIFPRLDQTRVGAKLKLKGSSPGILFGAYWIDFSGLSTFFTLVDLCIISVLRRILKNRFRRSGVSKVPPVTRVRSSWGEVPHGSPELIF